MDFLLDFQNSKKIKAYEKTIREIEKYSAVIVQLSDEELKKKTSEFKTRLKRGESLDDILPEVFAVAREASKRYLGIEQYPVQLMGAIALHNGDIAEMKTGEGKTYTAPLAAYLNALTGKSVHIATSNDTLATRDSKLVTPMFEGLGLTVGVVTEDRGKDYKEDIESRKKAYACDVIYGSSNAFAFDYLRDNTARSIDNVVRGDKEVGFVIIDEADQILVNDAVMPFKLSGSTKSFTDRIMDRLKKGQDIDEEKELSSLYSAASSFVFKLFKDEEHTHSFKTEEELNAHLGGDEHDTIVANRLYSVLFCPGVAASLTERGWLEAFRYFEGRRINDTINDDITVITKNPLFEEGRDYNLDEDRISLTLRGLELAAKEIPSIRNLNNLFYSSSEFSGLNKAIENALKAYFVLEKGKEYILKDVEGTSKKKVLLVSNGRTAEGRVYSDGLQQAIELKEKRLGAKEHIQIESTTEYDELASISQKSFYSIYPKISGMTGTSAEALFEEVYGMDTVRVPKNSEYRVSDEEIDAIYSKREDRDTVLFETDEEKMNAVIESVLASIKTGQPVLIGTTSVNESNRLYEEFQRRGIPCDKLNAEVSSIAIENEIIARAGMRGHVTISTQMAGRGTDIKLGGTFEDYFAQVTNEKVEMMVKAAAKDKGITDEAGLRGMRIDATSYVIKTKKDDITKETTALLEKEKEELIKVGGLKVIGYGHFGTKRDDDQLRGRAARQADPGVTEFYCSVKDLKRDLMVSSDKIRMLHKKGLGKDSPLTGPDVDKVISSAQANIEGAVTSLIANTQESDYELSKMRKKIYDQRMRALKGESPRDNMIYIIKSSVVNTIDGNLPSYSRELSPRTKIKKSGLDIDNFIIDVEETFGIDLSEAFETGQFKTLGDLQKYVSSLAVSRYEELRKTNGDEKQDEIDKKNILSTIDSAWLTFNSNLEDIKYENRLYSLAQNKDYDEVFAMRKGFNQCMITTKIDTVSKLIGTPTTKIRARKDEEVEREYDESLNEYYQGEEKISKLSGTPLAINFSIRGAKVITALVNGVKLIKDRVVGKIIGDGKTNSNNTSDKVETGEYMDGSTGIKK